MFDNQSQASVKIPLSKEVIKLNISNLDNDNLTNGKPKLAITSIPKFIIGLLFCLLAIVTVLLKRIKIVNELESEEEIDYDTALNNILDKYENLFTKTMSLPKAKKVMIIYSLSDLIEIREKLNETIKYYIVKEHVECYFFITHGESLYLFKLNEKDYEKKI